MEDLAWRGFTGALHTFSENDLNDDYRVHMRRIVEVSHGAALTEALTSDGHPSKGA